jgi:hypothetical protein
MIKKHLFCLSLIVFSICLVYADRFFLKKNDGFCIRNILGKLQALDAPDPFLEKEKDTIFSQPFFYLAKGHQSYVFISEDQKYILKFYRFPSHLRPMPWLNHPFTKHFSKRRKDIEEYNLNKFTFTLNSFKLAKEYLPKETGTLALHLNKTSTLKKKVTIVDQLKHHYSIDLDSTLFVVQKKAQMIYPILQEALLEKKFHKAKEVLYSLIQLAKSAHAKGIVNRDAIVEKNFGWMDGRAIFLDIGRFEQKSEEENDPSKMIGPLIEWLRTQNASFAQEIEKEIHHWN